MSAEREDLAKTIVREYQSNGIPAKLHHGMVLIHRDGELAGPFQAELLAPEFRAEIVRIKQHVLAKLETYGIPELLKKFGNNQRIFMFNFIINPDFQDVASLFGDDESLFRHARGILADPEFLAMPFYWNVARVLVRELGARDESEPDLPE